MTTTSPIGSGATTAAIASSNNPSGSTTNSAASLTQNFNTFLTLLTTQLQNQDPLSPLDTNQFTQQLVSFSEVEQQINTNSNLQQLIALQGAGESISALPLVGQNIEYNSATAPLTNGQANFVYTLPSATSGTALTVTDANGNVVYTQPGQTAAGTYVFNWNGQTNTGVQLPDGNYSLKIQTSTGTDGTTVTPNIASVGTVSSVGVQNGTATFTVGGMSIPMSELVTVNPNLTQSN
jgi:flagellar basal-body rod modification protein FlgD